MARFFDRFVKDRSGATAIEYALIAMFLGTAIIGGAQAVSGAINGQFQFLSNLFAPSGA